MLNNGPETRDYQWSGPGPGGPGAQVLLGPQHSGEHWGPGTPGPVFPQLGLPKGVLTDSKALVTITGIRRSPVPRGTLQARVPWANLKGSWSLQNVNKFFGVATQSQVSKVAKQSKAKQSKAMQCNAMQCRKCRAVQCNSNRSKASQSNAKQCKAEP